jgi:hypothetical protein
LLGCCQPHAVAPLCCRGWCAARRAGCTRWASCVAGATTHVAGAPPPARWSTPVCDGRPCAAMLQSSAHAAARVTHAR